MSLQAIGATLRDARKAHKLTQATLASRLGMSRATISSIENGTVSEIGIRKVIALCNELGLTLQVGREGQRPTLQQLRAEWRALRAAR
jgi:HTH-type transcriptional regulator / antitoxin HipB